MENQAPPPTIIYKSYTDAQKRAIYKYREKNKEKLRQKAKEYAKTWYDRNQDYHNKQCLERYHKKKALVSKDETNEN
tara:strand:+ start:470 stop:700 length:231 start_codon:yes stop_codon:yes gene_type:complete